MDTTKVYYVNRGGIHPRASPPAACHRLLLQNQGRLALIDTGIGLLDEAHAIARIGQLSIDMVHGL